MEHLKEFFALPGDLKLIGNILGGKIYTSQKLTDKYLEVLRINPITKNIYSELEKLVKEKRLIPCFATRGVITFIIHKLSIYNHSFERVAGFYYPEKNKIFIFIDNNMNILFLGDDDSLSRVTIHELVHMAAALKPKYFWRLFKDDLEKFYSVYYTKLFQLNNSKENERNIRKVVLQLINLFYFQFEKGENISLSKIFSLLQDFRQYSNLENNQFDKLCNLYCMAIFISSRDSNEFLSRYSNFIDIVKPIKETYTELYGEISNVIFYQEICIPSEVIAISLEVKITDKINSLIRSIL